MGKKYIIELEDKPFHKDGDFLYRVKGFNSLVFDMTGIGKLTPYIEPDLSLLAKENFERGYRQRKAEDEKEIEQIKREAYQDGYRRALADAREEHVCQTCVYFELAENEEPCVRCPLSFIDQYTPKQEQDEKKRTDYYFEMMKDAIETSAKEYGMSLDEVSAIVEKMREGQDD